MTRPSLAPVPAFLILLALLALNAGAGYAVLAPAHPHGLRVSFLDVGQGDAILVESPTGAQMLIDGGPDRSVLRALALVMGPLDRSIDLVVETHPDKDHIAGLADVLEQYEVERFLSPFAGSDTDVYARLMAAEQAEPGIETYRARRGMRIHLGGGAYADVLYPDRDVSRLRATNDASVTMHLVYGDTSFMLTGDLPSTLEEHILALDAHDGELPTTVLKAGHHGSAYSTGDAWLAALSPQLVVISAGAGNTYGHPSPEALARIERAGADVLSTINEGTITLESDGTRVVRH